MSVSLFDFNNSTTLIKNTTSSVIGNPTTPIATAPNGLPYTDDVNNNPWFQLWVRASTLILCPIGVIFSIISLCALYSKTFKERNPFYWKMYLMSLVDLIFCFFYIVFGIFFRNIQQFGGSSYWVAWMMAILRGFVFSLDYAGDLCTIALTFERYFGLCHPAAHRKLSDRTKRICDRLSYLVIICISTVCYQYTIILTVVEKIHRNTNQSVYFFQQSSIGKVAFITGSLFTTDVILPFILMAATLILSTRIIFVVIKRNSSKIGIKSHMPINPPPPPPAVSEPNSSKSGLPVVEEINSDHKLTTSKSATDIKSTAVTIKQNDIEKKKIKQMLDTIILILCLNFLFILKLTACCLIALISISQQVCPNPENWGNSAFCAYQLISQQLAIVSAITMCASRSLPFLLYVLFSGSFRDEFRKFIVKFRTMINRMI